MIYEEITIKVVVREEDQELVQQALSEAIGNMKKHIPLIDSEISIVTTNEMESLNETVH